MVNKARKRGGRRPFCKYSLPVFNTSGTIEIEIEEQETGYFVARMRRPFSCFALFGIPFPPFCVAISPILHRNLSHFTLLFQPFHLVNPPILLRFLPVIALRFFSDCAIVWWSIICNLANMGRICSRGVVGSKCASYAKIFVKEFKIHLYPSKTHPQPLPKGGESELEESPLVS